MSPGSAPGAATIALEHLLPDDRWITATTAGHNFVRKELPRGEAFCQTSQQQIQKVNWSCVLS